MFKKKRNTHSPTFTPLIPYSLISHCILFTTSSFDEETKPYLHEIRKSSKSTIKQPPFFQLSNLSFLFINEEGSSQFQKLIAVLSYS